MIRSESTRDGVRSNRKHPRLHTIKGGEFPGFCLPLVAQIPSFLSQLPLLFSLVFLNKIHLAAASYTAAATS
ncbi:hypothetical protein VNO78_20439 [Psophocarpus tetragonolobus]|uniref:Uncharacterized protein n=1 Tax=Psophocarpus tetragonolobus TaxID=3891 RepID=A0AAN9SDD6_PSOTE